MVDPACQLYTNFSLSQFIALLLSWPLFVSAYSLLLSSYYNYGPCISDG